MSTLALIGLGSNLGDRRAILDAGIDTLTATPGIALGAVSSYHETAPVGGPPGQGSFLNAAAAVATTLSPHALHARLAEIEHEAGRVRFARWGERTLDLDLLLFGASVIRGDTLTVPHPRMVTRRFVLEPACEIAPDLIHPLTGWTIAKLFENLDRRPSVLVLRLPIAGEAWNFREVVECLGATAVGDGSWVPAATSACGPGRTASILAQRERAFDHDLETLRAELSLDRFGPDHDPGRWIVTDRLPDHLFGYLLGWFDHASSLPRFIDRIEEVKSSTLRPTFEFTDSWRELSISHQVRKLEDRPRPIFDYPVVVADPMVNDPEARVSEILAACHAARPR